MHGQIVCTFLGYLTLDLGNASIDIRPTQQEETIHFVSSLNRGNDVIRELRAGFDLFESIPNPTYLHGRPLRCRL